MGFRFIILVLGFSMFAFSAQAKKKFENVKDKKIQIEDVEVVKDAPLETPESARLRQQRQQIEMETEEEFIQKLEQARIEDEKVRRQQLLEKEMRSREAALEEEKYPVPEPPPEVEIIAVGDDDEDVVEEPADLDWQPVSKDSSVTTTVILDDVEPEAPKYYIGLAAGGVNHQANNTPDMNGAGGISFGTYLGRFWILEASFMYSFVETRRTVLPDEDVDMYNISLAPKFTFGMNNQVVTPVVGPVLAFTRRQYNAGENASNAFDAGISAGIDISLSSNVKIGFEGRYMANVDYQRNVEVDSTQKALEEFATGRDAKPLEDFDYTVFLGNLKMVF